MIFLHSGNPDVSFGHDENDIEPSERRHPQTLVKRPCRRARSGRFTAGLNPSTTFSFADYYDPAQMAFAPCA